MSSIQQRGIWRRLRRQMERDDGNVSTPILAVVTLFLLLFGLQLTLYFIGANIAQTAAQAGYTAARAYEATAADGQYAAGQIMANQNGLLASPTVEVTNDGTTVTVRVTGQPLSLIPGLELPVIVGHTSGPVERWVPAP